MKFVPESLGQPTSSELHKFVEELSPEKQEALDGALEVVEKLGEMAKKTGLSAKEMKSLVDTLLEFKLKK